MKYGKSYLSGIRRRAAALALAGAMVFGMGGESLAFADETMIDTGEEAGGSLLVEDPQEAGPVLTETSGEAGGALFEDTGEETKAAAPGIGEGPETFSDETESEAQAEPAVSVETEESGKAEKVTEAEGVTETEKTAETEEAEETEKTIETEASAAQEPGTASEEAETVPEESEAASEETETAPEESEAATEETETAEDVPVIVMESAKIAENHKAAGGTASAAAPGGPVTVTPSFEGCTSLYNPSASVKNIVWTKDAVEGKTITLKADLKNVNLSYLKPDGPGSRVSFTWTKSNISERIIKQTVRSDFSDGKTDFTDTFTAKPGPGTYAYFCNIEVPDQNGDNMTESYRLVYIVRDPLTVETQDTTIHIAPYDEDQKKTGDVNMEVTALSAIEGDSYVKNPPYWHYTDQYEGVSTGTVKLKDDPDTRLRTQAALKGVDDAQTTVTCSVSSLYSPDEIYGERMVTFTIDTASHDWEDFKITKDATIWESGLMERTCKTCGYKDVEVIAKLTPSAKQSMKKVILQKGKSTDLYGLELQKGDSVVRWESSDHGICTVDGQKDGDCTIRARWAKGTAKVTATLDSGLVITVPVKVQNIRVQTQKITGLPKKVKLKKGKRLNLKPQIYPLTSQYRISYSSSDKTVASVTQKGRIRAKAPGKCDITVTSGKVSVKVRIIVPGIDAKKIYNVRKVYKLREGGKKQLKVKLYPSNSTSKLRFKSSNRKVVTVSKKGVIRARGKGTATVKIWACNIEHKWIAKTFKVTVR